MSMSVQFNGVELNEILDVVQGFTPFDGANMSPSFTSLPTGGSRYLSKTNTLKVFDMPFIMRNDKRGTQKEKYDRLEKILNVDEPKQLIFGVMPDRYFMAIPNGSLSYDETVFQGTGSIQWAVGDGLGHAIVEDIITPTYKGLGHYEIDITNAGSAPTPIRVEIEHKGDNGYVSLASQYGAVEIGNKSEIDKLNNAKGLKALHVDYNQEPPGIVKNNGVTCYPNYLNNPATPNLQVGNYKYYVNKYGTTIAEPVFTSVTQAVWHGPMITFDIPPDTLNNSGENFLFRARYEFSTRAHTAGRTEFTLSNGDQRMYSYVVRDSDYNSNNMIVEFHIKNTKMSEVSLDRKRFINGVYQIEINKLGPAVNFKVARADEVEGYDVVTKRVYQQHFNMDYIDALTVNKLSIWAMQFKDVPATSLGITSTIFYWADLEDWSELPNRFSKGDKLVIDGETKQLYLNGTVDYDDEILGSTYFLIPPGDTKVYLNLSNFIEIEPDIKVYLRKAWC